MSELRSAAPRAYHHGDLRRALLVEAERILETEGMQGLTLRAVARAAGVTHAAPANHFDDLTGLLSELAAVGFGRFAVGLNSAAEAAGPELRSRGLAMGRAYAAFAKRHPGLFTLMFRGERLDLQRPALQQAIGEARQALRGHVAERAGVAAQSPLAAAAQAVALWSLVHGYAVLRQEGRLNGILASLGGEVTDEALFEAVVGAMRLS